MSPRFLQKTRESVGTQIVNAVFSRLWNLGEDSGDEGENVEALAFGMGKQRAVMGAFALVEQDCGWVLEVMELCRRAGADVVALITRRKNDTPVSEGPRGAR